MSGIEQRLSQLLKKVVPDPPCQLSADRITTAQPVGRPARSWLLPGLSAAAVLVIGVTAGALATRHSSAGAPTAGGRLVPSPSVAAPAPRATGGASPQPTVSCHGATVIVPSVIGTSQDAAFAIAQQAGLNVGPYFAVPPASHAVPPGTVFAQSIAVGSRAVPGAVLEVGVAVAKPVPTGGIDPGFNPPSSPYPTSPCQAVPGTGAPSQATATVPDITGMARSQAIRVGDAAGFKVSVATTAPPTAESVPPGTVFAQTPAPGSRAIPGTGIDIFVAPASI